jgi:hypothetical protein
MQKVHIVIKTREVEYEFSETDIIGVYTDLKDAQKSRVALERDDPEVRGESTQYVIESHDLLLPKEWAMQEIYVITRVYSVPYKFSDTTLVSIHTNRKEAEEDLQYMIKETIQPLGEDCIHFSIEARKLTKDFNV